MITSRAVIEAIIASVIEGQGGGEGGFSQEGLERMVVRSKEKKYDKEPQCLGVGGSKASVENEDRIVDSQLVKDAQT